MYFYFYKITNLINNKFYYGVHQTNNLQDGYMGSGKLLKKAYKKYGLCNFKKQILMFFQNSQQMYQYQNQIVNEQIVNDKRCYNLIVGGKERDTMFIMSQLAKKSNEKDKYEKQKEGIIRYWTTGDVQAKKRKQSQANKKYWRTGDVEQKKRKNSEKIKQAHIDDPNIKKRISQSLKKYWKQENNQQLRKQKGQINKKSVKFQQFCKRQREEGKNKGYNNFDFINRWEQIYQENRQQIVKFLLKTDLPEDFIVTFIFNKNVKTKKLLNYYQYKKYLPQSLFVQKKHRFLKFENIDRKGHKDGCSKKTYYIKDVKKCMFIFEDFFEQFQKIKKFNENMQISDSSIVQGIYKKDIPNFYQVLQYFQQIGIIYNIRKQKIKVQKIVKDKKFKLTTTKTVFDIDYKKQNVILLDKELKCYEYDDDGTIICKGKFEL